MNYEETINFLFNQLPAFERQGNAGYKPGLQTSIDLDNLFGNPHQAYQCIHVAGTNGKGSVSHLIAAILQQQGYKVGLYTSPHLVDFRERMRVNGEMISKDAVMSFMDRYFATGYEGKPSFFELTSTMAMDYFKQQKVDFAVIEVGLGGRLDSTNIITPILSVITNITLEHTQFLGNTLAAVASEKAGIIKNNIPVVIGEATGEVRETFEKKALQEAAPITFAEDSPEVLSATFEDGKIVLKTAIFGTITDQLAGEYQIANANTVLTAIQALLGGGIDISEKAVVEGFAQVCTLTGLIGRWQQLQAKPRVICDSGHNVGAFRHIVKQLQQEHYDKLHMVIGFMKDKNVDDVLEMLPKDACYYFTNAATPRAMAAAELAEKAAQHGLQGSVISDACEAKKVAIAHAGNDDLVYLGGSMYVLAEVLTELQENQRL